MALVNMRDMLYHAYENSYAVGAFDLVSLDFLEAVVDAAERCRAPVILSIAEPHFAHYDIELMMPAVEAAAKRASIPVAIQLDHGSSLDSAIKKDSIVSNNFREFFRTTHFRSLKCINIHQQGQLFDFKELFQQGLCGSNLISIQSGRKTASSSVRFNKISILPKVGLLMTIWTKSNSVLYCIFTIFR